MGASDGYRKGGLEHLRVIVYQEGGMYVAQCLEKDIVTQAPDIPLCWMHRTQIWAAILGTFIVGARMNDDEFGATLGLD
jgi:hypothetical protein